MKIVTFDNLSENEFGNLVDSRMEQLIVN